MLFNSLGYFVFFPVVAIVFFLLPSRVRWAWLLAASWYFYGSWSTRYLALFVCNTAVAYLAGIGLERVQASRIRRLIAFGGVGLLLATLFTFKYLDFVAGSVAALLSAAGLHATWSPIRLPLPIGVSFYTFQAIAYV